MERDVRRCAFRSRSTTAGAARVCIGVGAGGATHRGEEVLTILIAMRDDFNCEGHKSVK